MIDIAQFVPRINFIQKQVYKMHQVKNVDWGVPDITALPVQQDSRVKHASTHPENHVH